MRTTTVGLLSVLLLGHASADIYLHYPRGSNNRNCRRNNNEDRENANRLFDSQNNDKGGYSCPRAWPFDCYRKYVPGAGNQEARDACNAINQTGATKDLVDENGVKTEGAVNTPMQYYYSGSELSIEWTNQHGMGTNNKLHSDVVFQYSCVEQLQDNCAEEEENPVQGCAALNVDTSKKLCKPRDGFPVANNNNEDNGLNNQATDRITTEVEEQDDYRYGRHESLEYYQRCATRERNKGLYIADQNLNGDTARYTRQNPNGNRYGLECAEEQAYWPYWHPSPWVDIAVVTSNEGRCEYFQSNSQNVLAKGQCHCPECNGDTPNSERECVEKSGSWCMTPPHSSSIPGLEAPSCIVGEYNRENHLGNAGAGANTNQFNWTIPEIPNSGTSQCVLRVRYNISTFDHDSISVNGDSLSNGDASPIKDDENNEEESYQKLTINGVETPMSLGFAVNTNQMGRVFQDRTYMFTVKPRPLDQCRNKIYNLGTRGKRGNIVQTYPSVEYDFSPQILVADEGDCVHVQFVGSDYNPNRNNNNGEGGPPSPLNNNEQKSDRHNLVQTSAEHHNTYVAGEVTGWNMFDATQEQMLRLAFIDQPVQDQEQCYNFNQLEETYENRNDRENSYHNCAKLGGASTPYFDGGLLKVGPSATYTYMSTRNNNFSNRDQKGVLIVRSKLSVAAIVGITLGAVAVVGGTAAWLFMFGGMAILGGMCCCKRGGGRGGLVPSVRKPMIPTRPASLESGVGKAVAQFDHEISEDGELAFQEGETITITKKDPSGWWEGRNEAGEKGVFPSNYVDEK